MSPPAPPLVVQMSRDFLMGEGPESQIYFDWSMTILDLTLVTALSLAQ